MLTLLLMRHAKSAWDDPSLSDRERPLTKRGRQEARHQGQVLAERGLLPQLIVTSPAVRAHETAVLLAKGCGYHREPMVVDDLYQSCVANLLRTVAAWPNEVTCGLLIGHNPEAEGLLQELTKLSLSVGTAHIAHLQLNVDRWAQVTRGIHAHLIEILLPPHED